MLTKNAGICSLKYLLENDFKTEITIDNQHVTKSLQRYKFLPKQPKENTEKITNLLHFLDTSHCLPI